MNKKTLFLFLLVISSTKLFASHLASAEIRYEYTGNPNEYKFYLTLLKACEPGSVMLNPTEVIEIGSLCGGYSQLTVYNTITDTVSFYCAGIASSCAMPGSPYPAFERKVYEGVTILPAACPDWKFSWTNCCRNGGIMNLVNPANYSTYIESTLDNSIALNTSAWFPNPSPFLVATGTTATIPIHTVDAENDSIDFEWVNPSDYVGGTSAPVTFLPGYSAPNPLGPGSTLSLDPVAQTLTVNAPGTGQYAMALLIKEYRNGILVGTTMRDFTIVSFPGNPSLTVPMPVAGTSLHYVTCPGQSHSITLNFMDSTATDSVFLSVGTPIIPGFTFTSSTTSGLGSASANISWTSPSTMNPATLPQFYFTIFAQDNSCPAIATAFYSVAVQTAQCNTDSVWAGDANGDYMVNIYDPLAIAVALGATGPARAGATTTWQAEYCTDWNNAFSNGVDKKHADCDGNGTVDNTDLAAVTANYGLVHLKPGGPRARTTGLPDLYFDVTGISFAAGSTVSVPIMLGNSSSPMNNLYGLASNINIGGITLAAPAMVTYPSSWIGNMSNTLTFTKAIPGNNSELGWAYARTDHQNVNGQGAIAMLNFTIPPNASGQVELSFTNTEMIDNNMVEQTAYNVLDATTLVTTGVGALSSNLNYAYVVPNPSANAAELQLMLQNSASVEIAIADVTGRIITRLQVNATAGEQTITLPASSLGSGIYFVRIQTQGKFQVIKWIRQ
jgi:hypothetical protein